MCYDLAKEDSMDLNNGIHLGVNAAILLFLWKLHTDIVGLSERIARIEGWIEGRFKKEDQ